jgi:hypothetical protein
MSCVPLPWWTSHDAADAVRLLGVTGRDRDVVEQAEAHRVRRRGVVPGRPDEAESRAILPLQYGIDRRATGAGRREADAIRRRAHDGIGVKMSAAGFGQPPDALDNLDG